MKGTILALLMGMLQSSTGYRPLQLYPAILKAAISIMYSLCHITYSYFYLIAYLFIFLAGINANINLSKYFRRRIPPPLSHEENEIFLTGILDKTIGATTEVLEFKSCLQCHTHATASD